MNSKLMIIADKEAIQASCFASEVIKAGPVKIVVPTAKVI
jgi:hypothetical protein